MTQPKGLIDSHCHLNSVVYDKDRAGLITQAREAGVAQIWDVGIDIESSRKSIEISKSSSGMVKSFVGIDPEVFIPGSPLFIGNDIENSWFEQQFKILDDLINQNHTLIVGIGESGMDNHWAVGHPASQNDIEASLNLQKKLFNIHLELASKYKLPLTIHSRGAEQECVDFIKRSANDVTGIFHSYTGTYKTAKQILDLGWGIGVNGIFTFKNANDLREMYKKILGKEVPADFSIEDLYKKGIYFETDGPFLAPEGKRGTRNEPANVKIVYDYFLNMINE